MHEMSLIEAVVQLIEEEARKGEFSKVRLVRLAVGALSHVSPDALSFCFSSVVAGTIAEFARLEIIIIPGQGWCDDCQANIAMSERFGVCPECGNHHVYITSGDELLLSELEVE